MAGRRDMQDCCVVTIGFTHLLLPAADGLKVLALLRKAAEVDRDYGGHEIRYIVGERPRCELEMVSPKQLKPKIEAPERDRKPLMLGHES
jgi:phosphoserine phosphatase